MYDLHWGNWGVEQRVAEPAQAPQKHSSDVMYYSAGGAEESLVSAEGNR